MAKAKVEEPVVAKERYQEARDIVRKNMYWSMGIGLVPVPVVDFLGVMGFQIKMLKELCGLYEVKFFKNKGKNLIAVLLGGVAPSTMSVSLGSLVKAIPLVGQTLGAVTMPVMSGASTYAVGKIFIHHFECGGTLLTFDPEKVKEHFAKLYEEGELIAAEEK